MSSKLFSPVQIGPLKIQNHFMRSPTYMNGCDNAGFPKKWVLDYYKEMADGKMGLIIPGYMYMTLAGKQSVGQACIQTDEHANAWKSTVEYIHKQGSKIVFQVVDTGTATTFEMCHERPRGASPQKEGQREMTKMEIAEVIENYTKAALRMQNVGVDGIELHAAHGYLISQFLSPANNRRTDEYGGSPENRRRLLQEIVSSIRSVVDKNFLVSAKINVDDCIPGGVTPEDLSETVKAIKGMDFYELSCGFQDGRTTQRNVRNSKNKPGYPYMEGYNVEGMKIVHKNNPNVPLGVCGGFKTLKAMEAAVDAGASLVSLSRPTIADPQVVKHLMEGDKQVKCVFCCRCYHEDGNRCSVYGKK